MPALRKCRYGLPPHIFLHIQMLQERIRRLEDRISGDPGVFSDRKAVSTAIAATNAVEAVSIPVTGTDEERSSINFLSARGKQAEQPIIQNASPLNEHRQLARSITPEQTGFRPDSMPSPHSESNLLQP